MTSPLPLPISAGAPERHAAAKISEEIVGAVTELARESPLRNLLATAARTYWLSVPVEELAQRAIPDLAGAMVAHFDLGRTRPRDVPLVRVYNPSGEDDRWQSPHTAVDLVFEDMAFLVDSVLLAVERLGLHVHLLTHPRFAVHRDEAGQLESFVALNDHGSQTEAYVHLEIDRLPEGAAAADLTRDLQATLRDVRAAVSDWKAMQAQAIATAELLESVAVGDPEQSELSALLRWLTEDNFTFLGFGEREVQSDPADIDADQEATSAILRPVEGSDLGVLRGQPAPVQPIASLAPPVAERLLLCTPASFTLTSRDSTVHRAGPMDCIQVRWRDPTDGSVHERRFLGLYTSKAHRTSVLDTPVVRRSCAAMMERLEFEPHTHDHSRLLAILEELPPREMFQINVDDLERLTVGIHHLREQPILRLFARRDELGHFVSCHVFIPRDRHNTAVRRHIEKTLCEAFEGTLRISTVHIGSSSHARLHSIVTTPNGPADVDSVALEAQIGRLTRSWDDDLATALVDDVGEQAGHALLARFRSAFPAAYRDEVAPGVAVIDMARLDRLSHPDLAVSLHRSIADAAGTARLKLYGTGPEPTLSGFLPYLDDLGVTVLEQHPYDIRPATGPQSWINEFVVRVPEDLDVNQPDVRRRFEAALLAVWTGVCESDGFGRLVLEARLDWRQVALLRAYRRYLRQLGSTFSQVYYDETLTAHPFIARRLIDLFDARFDPDRHDDERVEALLTEIDKRLERIPTLDQDRILRSFVTLIRATVRTNYFQTDDGGSPPAQLALKLNLEDVPDIPLPRPAVEVFVYSPDFEGVHLRAAPVARGGVRWSDRREDFRTEVLGLMKAQRVKNAVIVPDGGKGGFVVRRFSSTEPATVRAEVKAAYRGFISGLLDVTDNRRGDDVLPVPRTVCHDGEDPYLVVAADRGTADLSDVANAIALERGYWLGDSFASGGSSGYDHKAMGITALGAWESARLHFFELGIDVQRDKVTVVGIGDMSGDVFGNGLLLSRSLLLVAAFDHRHIFIDPDPDPERSWAERRRLFELPGSGWGDYDTEALSPGGEIVARTAKSVKPSARAREVLGIEAELMTPDELVSAILRAPVGLLWNGGIGTFVKASDETNDQASDRRNDSVRVNADELRCRVVVEGGNLGLTQRARVEFAQGGGLLNTDAIDNSAGVDTSDHEVNLKIFLDGLIRDGDLTPKQRQALLNSMTDDVAAAVLIHNTSHVRALRLARTLAPGMVDVHRRHIDWLARNIGFNRDVEQLPTDEVLLERKSNGTGLTQPELAVLLAHTKIVLKQQLLQSDLPDDPAFADQLSDYFPAALRDRFGGHLGVHPLRRELIVTSVVNRLVDRAGISFTHRLEEETGAHPADIARAHTAAWSAFDLESLWYETTALDGVADTVHQTAALLEIKRIAERASRWLVRRRRHTVDVEEVVAHFASGIAEMTRLLPQILRGSDLTELTEMRLHHAETGIPESLAERLAALPFVFTGLDLIELADRTGQALERIAAVYFLVGERLGLGWLRHHITRLPRSDRWQGLARSALRDDFYSVHATLAGLVVEIGGDSSAAGAVSEWSQRHAAPLDRFDRLLADIRATTNPGLDEMSVAVRELHNLVARFLPLEHHED